MEQIVSMDDKRGGLRGRLERLRHSERAAWWFALLAITGAVQFLSVFAIGVIFVAFQLIIHHQGELSPNQTLLLLILSFLVALAVAVYVYGAEKDKGLDPPRKRIPRKRWGRYATVSGAVIAVGVGYTIFWIWLWLVLGLVTVGRLAGLFDGLPGNPYLTIASVPALLGLWGFVAWRHVTLEVLENAQPPELRLATNIVRLSDEFQERAKALEKAMEEASAISEQVQRGIELEKKQLAELREQYRQEVHLKDLTAEEVSAVRFALAQEQARSARWGLWLNIVIAVVSLAAGVVIQALIDTEAIRERLQQWLNLG